MQKMGMKSGAAEAFEGLFVQKHVLAEESLGGVFLLFFFFFKYR